MATYNGEKFIQEQVSSILWQLSPCDELIISDDNSTDKTLDVIRMFEDDRIKIFVNELDKGYSGNFENAISKASGDLIFLSDQDDVWVAGKIQQMCAHLNSSELVVCNAEYVDEKLRPMNLTLFSLRGGRKGFFSNIYKSRYLGACMAFRRELLVKLLPFPKKRKLCPHDLWISLIAEFYFKVTLIEQSLVLYRRHGENVSSGGSGSKNSGFKKIEFRVYSIFMVLSRIFK